MTPIREVGDRHDRPMSAARSTKAAAPPVARPSLATRMRAWVRAWVCAWAPPLLTIGVMAGCVGDKGVGPSLASPATSLGRLHVTPLNAIMAVGDTMTLVVTGQTISGTPITDFDSVKYFYRTPTDSVRIRLSPNGLVTARAISTPNTPMLVNVFGFRNGGVAADQAVIQVVATAFSGATMSIQPIPPDSAKVALLGSKRIVPVIRNSSGQRIPSPTVRFEYGPGDSTILACYNPSYQATATLSQAQLQLSACGMGYFGGSGLDVIGTLQTGTAWVHARVRVFGVTLHDSVKYTVTNPYTGSVSIGTRNEFVDQQGVVNATIAPGGVVTFYNAMQPVMGASISWTFDDPTAATVATPAPTYGDSTGNIPPLSVDEGSTTRRFLRVGEFKWTATVVGGIAPFTGQTVKGTIIVQ